MDIVTHTRLCGVTPLSFVVAKLSHTRTSPDDATDGSLDNNGFPLAMPYRTTATATTTFHMHTIVALRCRSVVQLFLIIIHHHSPPLLTYPTITTIREKSRFPGGRSAAFPIIAPPPPRHTYTPALTTSETVDQQQLVGFNVNS